MPQILKRLFGSDRNKARGFIKASLLFATLTLFGIAGIAQLEVLTTQMIAGFKLAGFFGIMTLVSLLSMHYDEA
jgi:hypothetical protein